MEARPRIKIELSKADKVLEAFCLMLLALLWLGTIAGYAQLPDQIPTHFNASGKADDFGGKAKIFTLPIIATIIYIGMSILNRHPHLYNYPSTITPDNAERLYTLATKLIRAMKLIVVFIFTMIVAMTYRSALTDNSGLGGFFLPASVLLLILPTVFYWFKGMSKPLQK